jgi:hypothetical protein
MSTNLHLKLPAKMIEDLQPTGCRNSKEAEASWRLGAAIDVVREFKSRGQMPILGLAPDEGNIKPKEMHIPLAEAQISFLNDTSREEGGSRGKLTRELLATAHKAVKGFQGCLNHEGLVREIKKLFPDST